MKGLVSLVFALGLPQASLALSCGPWTVQSAYLAADAADEAYLVAHGELNFDVDLLPNLDMERQDAAHSTLVPAHFDGMVLTRRGFTDPLQTMVVLNVQCLGPWCAGAEPGKMLGFLARTESGYELATDPCGGFLFPDPQPAQLDAVRRCFQGRRCELPQF